MVVQQVANGGCGAYKNAPVLHVESERSTNLNLHRWWWEECRRRRCSHSAEATMGQLSDGTNDIVLGLEQHRCHAKEGCKEQVSGTVGGAVAVGGVAVGVRWCSSSSTTALTSCRG